MKILIVHNAYQSHLIGGEDIVVQSEIAELQRFLGTENIFEYQVSNDDIVPIRLLKNIWGDQTHYNAIFNMVKNHGIDIVHVHNFFPLLTPSVFKAAKNAGAKVVHTVHNFRWRCISGIFYRKNAGTCEKCKTKNWGWPAIIHRCYRNSFMQSFIATLAFAWYHFKKVEDAIDTYIALSIFQKNKLAEFIPIDKIILKPNGVYPATVLLPPQLKKGYLFVGRLESAKGIDLLLSIWEKLPKKYHLRIIGDGPDAVSLKQRFEANNIEFLGKQSHDFVLGEMKKAKYLLQTSLWYETFGLTLVEAFSRATPVIGFAIGTRKELIRHGENGFLCEPNALKETLLMSYDYADYAGLSQNTLLSVKSYLYQNIIPHQVEVYQQILGRA